MSNSGSPTGDAARMSRRGFLQAGSGALAGLWLPSATLNRRDKPGGSLSVEAVSSRQARNCIFLLLLGGPSQLDTFDPKPDAPSEIRGPYRPLRTNVRGIHLTELLPRTARQVDKFAIIRSMHHTGPALHDSGHQQVQTGWLFSDGLEHPHLGCACGMLRRCGTGILPVDSWGTGILPVKRDSRDGFSDLPAHVILNGPIGNTGGGLSHGQSGGFLGVEHDPLVIAETSASPAALHDAVDVSTEADALRRAYGQSRFGRDCLRARRLVENGVRFVTVNMFRNLLDSPTWDVHGCAPFGSVRDCRGVAADFDAAYPMLLADLATRGLLRDTLVVATGEFGRTPRINPGGGRDHWPQCWSMLLAGGGIRGGQVLGSSDAIGAYPKERPTTPAEVAATIYHCLGVPPGAVLPGPQGRTVPLVEPGTRPIAELL